MARRAWLVVLVILGASATAFAQEAPQAQFSLGDRGRPHADVPFTVDLIVEGFEQSPAPDQPKLEIAGATVTAVGVQPNLARSISIVNGRRVDSTTVTWRLRWRVLVHAPGNVRVPSTTVKQGSKTATAPPGDVPVDSVPTSDEMKLELALPDRPVFVGETVPIKIVWLFVPQPEDQSFAVPMMSLDSFTISAPPVPQGSRRVLKLAAGAKDLEVPFDVDETTVGGVKYNRLIATFYAAPRRTGKVEVPASSVVSALRVGRPDFFGNAATKLFRAADTLRTLDVKPLPETDKPATFSGAVGEQFAIEVHTSRSVVSLGEPVELDVKVKSDQRLDTLALGKLDAAGRLPKDKFTVPAEPPTGELSEDGKTKTFKVVAQVTGPATEIPALAFAYFDPKKQQYQTIHSEPIALSVKGGTIVDASDVFVGGRTKTQPQPSSDDGSLVTADLALSSPGAVEDTPLGGIVLWLVIALLYAVPLALLGFRSWRLRTAESREEAGEVHVARKRVEELLDLATSAPARDVAGPLVAALRDFARVLGRSIDDHGLLAKLETESFAPDASGKPLSPDLRSDAAGLLRRWSTEARRARGTKTAAAIAIAGLMFGGAASAHADSLADGRASYQYAMEQQGDPTGRKTAFARAAIALGDAAREHPEQPELLADWGNAALGAGDVATATLAYRRALTLDAGNPRARHNLAWLRNRLPDVFKPSASASATDTLLFFHRWTRAWRLLVGAAAFAIGILLLVPWTGRRSWLAMVALLPFAVWLAMMVSVVFQDGHAADAIVVDAVPLRAADSAGAPAALPQTLPRGAEVTILERRDAWTRIEIANGTAGWVPDGAIERISH
ncbi:MAG: hypothetical protein ABI867_25560 [Kofleriaceae bacterium]